MASLTSVEPRTAALSDADLAELLDALRWSAEDLDPALPPRLVAAKQADLAITYQPQLHFFADQGLPLRKRQLDVHIRSEYQGHGSFPALFVILKDNVLPLASAVTA